ncbi:MAG: CpXC domain-containing protein [Betaproteobacteria bacterium]|nr:CpXC domain-containing protein [Betaproteobacteria bacterium]
MGLFAWLQGKRIVTERVEPGLSARSSTADPVPPPPQQAAAPATSEMPIQCPKCGQKSKFTVHGNLNGALHPDLENDLFSGKLIAWECASCGRKQLVAYPLMYHNANHKFMMLWFPYRDLLSGEKIAKVFGGVATADLARIDCRFRIVTEHADLVEKARIFSCGLDDRVVEWFKYAVVEDGFAKPGTPPALREMMMSRESQPRFLKLDRQQGRDGLTFSYPALGKVPGYPAGIPPEMMTIWLPREQYERIAADVERVFPMPQPVYGRFTLVDHDLVRRVKSGPASAKSKADSSHERTEEERLRYVFEHVALRAHAFENHPELVKDLSGKGNPANLFWRSWWEAERRCGLPEEWRDNRELLESRLRVRARLSVQAFKRGDYTVYAVIMPPPGTPADCYFAAVVYRDGEPRQNLQPAPSTRYFTLEMTHPGPAPVFCEWTREGNHANYGEGPPPELKAFVEAVFARLSAA